MDRRRALITIGLTAFSGAAWSLTRPRLLPVKLIQASAPATETVNSASNEALDDRLRRDLARRSQRINSEEGIAMFLVCENLVPDKSSHQPPRVALTPANKAFATAFQRNAEAWQRIRPDAQYKDVAQIIEVMAYRDFTNGETAEGQ